MPNRLRYCGGDDNHTLFEYGIDSTVDGGLTPLLRRFSGALPHHSFHVLDVHSGVGELEHSLHTLDSCRVRQLGSGGGGGWS